MNSKSILFSVGPLEMYGETMKIGGEKIPYFRTEEFSKINLEICCGLRKIAKTSEKSEVVLLTASGTGAMEAAVINVFTKQDRVLVISGGSFGDRFTQICKIHNINYDVLKLKQGQAVTSEMLNKYRGKGYTGLLINAHETSTCVYYNIPMIGQFCKEEGCIFVVDAISSFLADDYFMDAWNIDVTILSTQKALAVPPGMSILIINKRTVQKINNNQVESLYFNLKDYFNNIKRGQTPYTPAVGILLQLKQRINYIQRIGSERVIESTKTLAKDFRNKIKDLPFTIPSESLSNAATPLKPREKVDAHEIFEYLKNKYNIFVCPNGGKLSSKLFRVGHMLV